MVLLVLLYCTVQVLDVVAQHVQDKRQITYLDNKGRETQHFSFGETRDHYQRIGAYLQREMGLRPGDRAILIYPPGAEFLPAFLGCVYAGVVAVPVFPPVSPNQYTNRARRMHPLPKKLSQAAMHC